MFEFRIIDCEHNPYRLICLTIYHTVTDCKEIYTQIPTTSLMSSNSLPSLQNESETGYLLFTFLYRDVQLKL